MHKKTKTRDIPLKKKLFVYFMIFSFLILGVLWGLQIFLLDSCSVSVTERAMERVSALVAQDCEKEGFSDDLLRLAEREQLCIALYRIADGSGIPAETAEVSSLCVVHKLKTAQLERLYNAARASGGTLHTKGQLTVYTTPFGRQEILTSLPELEEMPSGSFTAQEGPLPYEEQFAETRLLFCRLAFAPSGNAYMILADAGSAPLTVVSRTLQAQLIWVSILLVCLSLVLATFASARLAAPIMHLHRGASALAEGRYDADFESHGYLEVSELGDALEAASAELGKADRMQKELVANLSHDLRTPLTVISGYAEMMRDMEGEATEKNLQVIIDEAHRLSAMVSDVLRISDTRTHARALKKQRFSLSELLLRTATRYTTMRRAEGFTFPTEIAEELWVTGDITAIGQVVDNLLNNAVNYSGDARTVTLRAEQTEDGYAHVDVIDRGQGIPAEELPHIWQRYYRADYHDRHKAGSGLGLSIVQELLEAHAARYGVESGADGSRFWFELPLTEE